MIIYVKNKDTLTIGDFHLKCCVGKNGLNINKKEGDYTTPKGIFSLNKLYFREDRLGQIKSKIQKNLFINCTVTQMNWSIYGSNFH